MLLAASVLFIGGFLMIISHAAQRLVHGGSSNKKEITFSKDVAPIFYKNCTSCHRPGDIAPMSLLTYQDARPWARSIREKVVTREMPPWHADPHTGEFANDARLSQKEIDTIVAWVGQGAKEGDARELPPQPTFTEGWKIGKPDLVIQIPEEHTVAANAPDEYVYFRVPSNFKEDVWVQSVELRPGNRKVVHHAHTFTGVPNKTPEKPSEQKAGTTDDPWKKYFYREGKLQHIKPDAPQLDDGCSSPDGGYLPGKKDMGGEGILVSYLPGNSSEEWPVGYAKKIPAGAEFTFQIHYSSTTGREEKDRSSVGIIFAKAPPLHPIKRIDVHNFFFKIPAGADNHQVTACYTFEESVQPITYTPHMHYRGKDMKFEALYPDGRRETLLWVPNYNFNWQETYQLKNPGLLPKGTKFIITAHFDNSAKNKYNPDPTKVIRWGEPSTEEMMDGWIEYVLPPESKLSAGQTLTK
jgi:hypothetical protein